jgi:hypothetical protein
MHCIKSPPLSQGQRIKTKISGYRERIFMTKMSYFDVRERPARTQEFACRITSFFALATGFQWV